MITITASPIHYTLISGFQGISDDLATVQAKAGLFSINGIEV